MRNRPTRRQFITAGIVAVSVLATGEATNASNLNSPRVEDPTSLERALADLTLDVSRREPSATNEANLR